MECERRGALGLLGDVVGLARAGMRHRFFGVGMGATARVRQAVGGVGCTKRVGCVLQLGGLPWQGQAVCLFNCPHPWCVCCRWAEEGRAHDTAHAGRLTDMRRELETLIDALPA